MFKAIGVFLLGVVFGVVVLPVAIATANVVTTEFASNHPLMRIAKSLEKIASSLEHIERKK